MFPLGISKMKEDEGEHELEDEGEDELDDEGEDEGEQEGGCTALAG